MRKASGLLPWRTQWMRKNRWVTKIMNHVNMAPNMATAIISMKDCSGLMMLNSVATAMPRQDSSSAGSGTPREFTRPSTAGAWPARERLNIMRVVMYSWLFMADRAATSTTKLTTLAAPGRPMISITFTKGLPSLPAADHGTMASISAIVAR